eukprot:10334009-Alexandrium_andersonii.AAC.1
MPATRGPQAPAAHQSDCIPQAQQQAWSHDRTARKPMDKMAPTANSAPLLARGARAKATQAR